MSPFLQSHFALAVMDLTTSMEILMMIQSLEKSYVSKEIEPPAWNVVAALRNLSFSS